VSIVFGLKCIPRVQSLEQIDSSPHLSELCCFPERTPPQYFHSTTTKKTAELISSFQKKKIIHWFCEFQDLQKKNSLSSFAFKRSCASSGISVL
jgi:hypothetical protein